MSRVRAFFLQEGAECLDVVRAELAAPSADTTALHRAVRRFRGSAQMARFGALAATARELEHRLRPYRDGTGDGAPLVGAGGAAAATPELYREARKVLETLERGVEAVREGRMEEDPRMEMGMEDQGYPERGGELEVVPVETLEYSGEGALARALELRDPLEDAIVAGEGAGPILDELFDLIRLGVE